MFLGRFLGDKGDVQQTYRLAWCGVGGATWGRSQVETLAILMLLVTEETWKQMMVRGFVGTTRAKRGTRVCHDWCCIIIPLFQNSAAEVLV